MACIKFAGKTNTITRPKLVEKQRVGLPSWLRDSIITFKIEGKWVNNVLTFQKRKVSVQLVIFVNLLFDQNIKRFFLNSALAGSIRGYYCNCTHNFGKIICTEYLDLLIPYFSTLKLILKSLVLHYFLEKPRLYVTTDIRCIGNVPI